MDSAPAGLTPAQTQNVPMHLIDRIVTIWNKNQQIRFLCIGAYNTAFGYGTFLVLYATLGAFIHYLVLSVIAHFVAVTNSYLLQRIVVFKSKNAWPMEFARFNLSHLATLGISLVALHLLVEYAFLSPVLAQGIVLIVVVMASYILHRLFSFRSAVSSRDIRNQAKE